MRSPEFVVAALLISSTAYAADHLMHVDEVMLNGGAGEQYIELHDDTAESLPSGPYKLEVYTSAGTLHETVTLSGITAGASAYFTVGNAAADTTYSAVTFDATLTMALPNPGQACFVRAAGSKVHCVAWGCNTAPIAGAQTAEAPSSGMSLSRQASGQLQFSTATPDAANSAGTVPPPACPNVIPDAGVTPDAPGGNNNNPDAGTDPGGSDDDSGCCQSSTPTSTAGGGLLSLLVLGTLLRRRR